MSVMINLSPEAEQTFKSIWGSNLDRKAFEAMLIQCYRDRTLSVGKLAELLGLSTTSQADEWLRDQGIDRNLDASDLNFDQATMESLQPK